MWCLLTFLWSQTQNHCKLLASITSKEKKNSTLRGDFILGVISVWSISPDGLVFIMWYLIGSLVYLQVNVAWLRFYKSERIRYFGIFFASFYRVNYSKRSNVSSVVLDWISGVSPRECCVVESLQVRKNLYLLFFMANPISK